MKIASVTIGDDADELLPVAPEKPAAMRLDAAGEIVKTDNLPADFPANVTPLNDGSGGFLMTLDWPKTLNYTAADGSVIRSETFTTLTLNRLDGKAHKAVQAAAREGNGEMLRATALAAMTGLKLGQCRVLDDKMDAGDIAAFMRVYVFFTTPGRRTGP